MLSGYIEVRYGNLPSYIAVSRLYLLISNVERKKERKKEREGEGEMKKKNCMGNRLFLSNLVLELQLAN